MRNPLYRSKTYFIIENPSLSIEKMDLSAKTPGFSNSSAFHLPHTVYVKISANKTVKKPCVNSFAEIGDQTQAMTAIMNQ